MTFAIWTGLRVFAAIVFFSLATGILSVAHAYKVSPLVETIEPTGKGSKTYITIENTHDYPLTIELSAIKRIVQDGDGAEVEVSAEDDWLIFPPQKIIEAGKTQRIRVEYIGGPIEQSAAYRIDVTQLPVSDASGQTRVLMNYRFRPAFYVVPNTAELSVDVTGFEALDDGYKVSLKNTGSRHAVLSTGVWIARDASGAEIRINQRRTEAQKLPLIAPGGTRDLMIPMELLGSLGPVTDFVIKPER